MVAKRADGVPIGPVGQRGGGRGGQRGRTAPVLKTKFEDDIIKTNRGDLKITSIANTSLMFTFENKVIYVDPVEAGRTFPLFPKPTPSWSPTSTTITSIRRRLKR